MKAHIIPMVALLGGCGFFQPGPVPYYDGTAPSISGLSVESERGNLGGQSVTISGSGFGTDTTKIVVQFGDHNADIVSLSDSAIEVVTPPGPVTGGGVDVVVATEGGYTRDMDAYTYDPGPLWDEEGTETSPFYAEETGFIVLSNYYNSLYGDYAGWVGQAGIGGVAEFLSFPYPRYHTQDLGMFAGAGDQGTEEWAIERPGDVNYIFSLEDLRLDIGDFYVENTAWTEVEDGDPNVDCVEWDTYEMADPGECEATELVDYNTESGVISYNLGRMQFCEADWLDSSDKWRYVSEYPIGVNDYPDSYGNFFAPPDGSETEWAEIRVQSEDLFGSSGLNLVLPPSAGFVGTKGFTSNGSSWAEGGIEECFPSGNRGEPETNINDVAVRIEWTPYPGPDGDEGDLATLNAGKNPYNVRKDQDTEDRIKDVRHYVRFSITFMTTGWFGGDAYPQRATIVIPDVYNFDRESGHSVLEIPASLLWSFPTGITPASRSTVDPTKVYGYIMLEPVRVTEYLVSTDLGTDIVVAYNSGDLLPFSYTNPLERSNTCEDCFDNDGDGWVDGDDPDCVGAMDENVEQPYYGTACNNGIDDDGDGWVDAEDVHCFLNDGDEAVEAPAFFDGCADGLDNDVDGFIDGNDPDCETEQNDEEMNRMGVTGLTDFSCYNGVDDDADGWRDAEDPGCLSAVNGLPSGFGDYEGADGETFACNNGVDDDGDGYVDEYDADCESGFSAESACTNGVDDDGDGHADMDDVYCKVAGTSGAAEVPTFEGDCANGSDDDADGFVDALDPACETESFDSEGTKTGEPGLDDFQCYNGVDDDGDSFIDAEDPACWSEDHGFQPYGMLDDESADTCANGVDDDLDGTLDAEDPDCGVGIGKDE